MKLDEIAHDHPDDMIPPNAYGYALGRALGMVENEFRRSRRTVTTNQQIEKISLWVSRGHPVVAISGMRDIGIVTSFKQSLKKCSLTPDFSVIMKDYASNSLDWYSEEYVTYVCTMELEIELDLKMVERGYAKENGKIPLNF